MARWRAWARGGAAVFSCGAVAVLTACSAAPQAAPKPASVTSSAGRATPSATASPSGSAGLAAPLTGLAVSAALAAAGRSDGPPPPLFTYRGPDAPLASAGETRPTSVRVDAPGQPEQRWD